VISVLVGSGVACDIPSYFVCTLRRTCRNLDVYCKESSCFCITAAVFQRKINIIPLNFMHKIGVHCFASRRHRNRLKRCIKHHINSRHLLQCNGLCRYRLERNRRTGCSCCSGKYKSHSGAGVSLHKSFRKRRNYAHYRRNYSNKKRKNSLFQTSHNNTSL